jgi:hypothetical protein
MKFRILFIKYLALCYPIILFLTSCSIHHDYKWTEYQIAPNRIIAANRLNQGEITLINEQNDKTIRLLNSMGPNNLYGTLFQLSESIITQLASELEERKVRVINNTKKNIAIRVENAEFARGMWGSRANMNVTITAGNNYRRVLSITNFSPQYLWSSWDGAIALTVIDILNDNEIIEYINK